MLHEDPQTFAAGRLGRTEPGAGELVALDASGIIDEPLVVAMVTPAHHEAHEPRGVGFFPGLADDDRGEGNVETDRPPARGKVFQGDEVFVGHGKEGLGVVTVRPIRRLCPDRWGLAGWPDVAQTRGATARP